MMAPADQDLYDRLGDLYRMIGMSGPKGDKLRNVLRAIYVEDEARTALAMTPGIFQDAAGVARALGEEVSCVAERLETMTNKGLLYCKSEPTRQYKLLQLFPGVFELQFMKGDRRQGDVELARLFEEVLHAPFTEGPPPRITPFARVVPIEQQIEASIGVHTYEQVSHYIDQAEEISLSTCYCRHQKELLGKACAGPKDVCMQFGPFARFVYERGFGRKIGREEAHAAVRRAVEAGLVLTSNNTRKRIDFICACCGCCCGILTSVKNSRMPSLATSSNFTLAVDRDACTGCGACVEACHMEALELEGDAARVDPARCIGCAVCTLQCPADALRMVRRPDQAVPPETFRELQAQIVDDLLKSGMEV
ncbi:MAG: 4Fe-4S binding protein [bacterium]